MDKTFSSLGTKQHMVTYSRRAGFDLREVDSIDRAADPGGSGLGAPVDDLSSAVLRFHAFPPICVGEVRVIEDLRGGSKQVLHRTGTTEVEDAVGTALLQGQRVQELVACGVRDKEIRGKGVSGSGWSGGRARGARAGRERAVRERGGGHFSSWDGCEEHLL